jgi:hypothetical protein
LLSECDKVIKVNDKYTIEIPDDENLIVCVGFDVKKKLCATFKHPNIAASEKKVFEFKHSRNNGTKFYTQKAGINHYFIIPKNQIRVFKYEGYSYVEGLIGDVRVTFNVSGGGCEYWKDIISTNVSIFINHSLSDLKNIASVAIKNNIETPLKISPMTEAELNWWNELAFKTDSKIKEEIYKLIEMGKFPRIILTTSEKEGVGVEVIRAKKCNKIDEVSSEWKYNGKVKGICVKLDEWRKPVAKLSQINFYETALVNGI